MVSGRTNRIRFGAFEADLAKRTLRKSGVRVPLQDKPFRLLAALLEQPGQTVTREELKLRLWPEERYGEFDVSLNTAVRKVRQVLGDSATHPQWIETIPKVGYRFVEQPEIAPAPRVTLVAPDGVDARRPPSWLEYSALGLAVVVVAGSAILGVWTGDSAASHGVARRVERPLTSYPGYEAHPALSPDGTRVAFVWNGEDQGDNDIYVLGIGDQQPVRLTDGPAPERHPAWSPDGLRLAFLRLDGAGATLHITSATGLGGERRLARLNIGGEGFSYGLDWSPDGRFLAAQNTEASAERRGIFLISVETGAVRRLTMPPEPYSQDRWPAFSPDGRTIAFARGPTTHRIYAVEIDEDGRPVGDAKPLHSEPFYIRGLDWDPNGERVIFAGVTTGGMMELRTVSVAGGAVESLLEGHGAELPSVSRRASDSALLVAYVEETDDSDLFRIPGPAARPASAPPPIPEKVASSTRYEHSPRLSPDGARVAFVSYRSGAPELWVANTDGSHALQLTDFEAAGGAAPGSPRWSPDSRYVAFNAGLDGHQDVFLASVAGGELQRLTKDPSNETRPSFSRDGRWLYITSDRLGSPDIWKTPVEGGEPVRFTDDRGLDACESPDGKWVYYAKRYGQFGEKGIYRRPAAGGPEERVLDEGGVGKWALSASGIYLYRPEGENGRPVLELYPHGKRRGTTILELPKGGKFGSADGLTVSEDDRWIVFEQKPQISADLALAVAP